MRIYNTDIKCDKNWLFTLKIILYLNALLLHQVFKLFLNSLVDEDITTLLGNLLHKLMTHVKSYLT